MTDKTPTRLLTAYIFIGMLTFGYSYNKEYNLKAEIPVADATFTAFGCSIVWPLYLSVKLFQGVRT